MKRFDRRGAPSGAMALVLAATAAAGPLAAAAPAAATIPPWDFAFSNQSQWCFRAPTPSAPAPRRPGHHHHSAKANDRLVWLSLPEGTPPAAGWPVWISLVTDSFGADPKYGDAPGVVCASSGGGKGGFHPDKGFYPFSLPAAANISASGDSWNYDQEAGAMWNQRVKQHMVANGIAVLCLNPISIDSWDAGPWWVVDCMDCRMVVHWRFARNDPCDACRYWNDGADRPYLSALFAHLKSGT
jgi:hypothetical protein